jgi:hypothetical protein
MVLYSQVVKKNRLMYSVIIMHKAARSPGQGGFHHIKLTPETLRANNTQ